MINISYYAEHKKEAFKLLVSAGKISESYLQRKLNLTFQGAKIICDELREEMKNARLDIEFINRCNEPEFQEYVNEFIKSENEERMIKDSSNYIRDSYGKFTFTEKNKESKRKHFLKRYLKIREDICSCSEEEKFDIKKFYYKCPAGYEVDHIIPLSKGGKHRLDNLQYLTKEENRRKSNSLDWSIDKALNIEPIYISKKNSLEALERRERRYKSEKFYESMVKNNKECVFLKIFKKKKICPECLKKYESFHKICEVCPNEITRAENKKIDEHFEFRKKYKERKKEYGKCS